MTTPISPDPIYEWRPEYPVPYISNGIIGLRMLPISPTEGTATLNGFVSMDPETGLESFAEVPFPLSGDLRVGRFQLSEHPDKVHLVEMRYDFTTGELSTELIFHCDDGEVRGKILTFCSRTQPSIAVRKVELQIDRDADIEITVGVRQKGVPGSWADAPRCPTGQEGPLDCLMLWASPDNFAQAGIAYATELMGAERVFRRTNLPPHGAPTTTYAFHSEPGGKYCLHHYVSIVPDQWHGRPHFQAARLLTDAFRHGCDQLRADNKEAWAEVWQSRIQLVGAPEYWQRLVDAAYFYLQTSVHRSAPASTHIFGMSYWPDYHYYRGHIMWDIEMFCLPTLLLTHPEAARALLAYRSSRLRGALSNANARGYTGAQFPWESSPRAGYEAAPVETPHAFTQVHVSMDIAIAFARYVQITGDWKFAEEAAWPVMSEVAQYLTSRVERTARGTELRAVNGIAETRTTVDNSAFVNATAISALRETIDLGRKLGKSLQPAWREIADTLVLPIDPETKVLKNHDTHDPHEIQGATPEAAAVIFPLGFEMDEEVERRTLEYQLSCADRYVGMPILSPMLGVYAARLGDRKLAAELFRRGYADFVLQPFGMATEFSPASFPEKPRPVPFTANMGGFLSSILYGLTGLRASYGDVAGWCKQRVVLPEDWEEIRVDRLWVRGQQASLVARHGDHSARFELW